MKKRFFSFIVLVVICFSLTTPVFADSDNTNTLSSSIVYLDNGDYVVIRVEETVSLRSTVKTGNKHYNYYHANGTLLWRVTLTGTFEYTYGVSSTCTKASHKETIYDSNWSVGSATAYKSGNTAYADVTMDQRGLGILVYHKNVNLTLSCDKYGNLT